MKKSTQALVTTHKKLHAWNSLNTLKVALPVGEFLLNHYYFLQSYRVLERGFSNHATFSAFQTGNLCEIVPFKRELFEL